MYYCTGTGSGTKWYGTGPEKWYSTGSGPKKRYGTGTGTEKWYGYVSDTESGTGTILDLALKSKYRTVPFCTVPYRNVLYRTQLLGYLLTPFPRD
jgi:hypothetical protein